MAAEPQTLAFIIHRHSTPSTSLTDTALHPHHPHTGSTASHTVSPCGPGVQRSHLQTFLLTHIRKESSAFWHCHPLTRIILLKVLTLSQHAPVETAYALYCIFNLTGAIVMEKFPYKDIQDSEKFIQSMYDDSATLCSAGIIVLAQGCQVSNHKLSQPRVKII